SVTPKMSQQSSDPRAGEGQRTSRRATGRQTNGAQEELPHVVRFYDSHALLTDAAAEFVSAGLKAQEPALLVVTLAGLKALREQLTLRGFDVDSALREGLVVHLDAQKTLDAVL